MRLLLITFAQVANLLNMATKYTVLFPTLLIACPYICLPNQVLGADKAPSATPPDYSCNYDAMLEIPWVGVPDYNPPASRDEETCAQRVRLFLQAVDCYSEADSFFTSSIKWTKSTNYSKEVQEKYNKLAEKFEPLSVYDIDLFQGYYRECYDYVGEEEKRILTLNMNRYAIKDSEDVQLQNELSETLRELYNYEEVCKTDDDNECYRIEPDLSSKIGVVRDFDELKWIYEEFRNQLTPQMKDIWLKSSSIESKWAAKYGLSVKSEAWVKTYEMSLEQYKALLTRTMKDIKPLYSKMHAYIRHKLGLFYGFDKVPQKGTIPAHLTGNLWNQKFDAIFDILNPYPELPATDITKELKRQFGTNVTALVEFCVQFYYNLGFNEIPHSFWEESMFVEPPPPQRADCHGAAFNLYDGVRLKICGEIDYDTLLTTIHELGHIFYYNYDDNQRPMYQRGANPAFHESIGDVFQFLALALPEFIRNNWMDAETMNDAVKLEKIQISNLLLTASEKLMLVPASFIIDHWQIEFDEGLIPNDELNQHWWKLINDYQGIGTPDGEERSEKYFDIASKYHVATNIPNYSRYGLARILQFQFLKAICESEFKQGVPLHRCNVRDKPDSTKNFRQMLSMGSSRPWPDAMEVVTGERYMDVGPLLEYFKPLEKWLDYYIKENQLTVGWDSEKRE